MAFLNIGVPSIFLKYLAFENFHCLIIKILTWRCTLLLNPWLLQMSVQKYSTDHPCQVVSTMREIPYTEDHIILLRYQKLLNF